MGTCSETRGDCARLCKNDPNCAYYRWGGDCLSGTGQSCQLKKWGEEGSNPMTVSEAKQDGFKINRCYSSAGWP